MTNQYINNPLILHIPKKGTYIECKKENCDNISKRDGHCIQHYYHINNPLILNIPKK